MGSSGTVRTWLADATWASWSLCTTWRYQSRPKRATKSEKTTMPMTDNRRPRESPGIPTILLRRSNRPKSPQWRSPPSNAQRWTHSAGTASSRFTTPTTTMTVTRWKLTASRSPNTVPIKA